MGHNSVVSGHSKSTGIPRVYGLSTGPLNLGCHKGYLKSSQQIGMSSQLNKKH